MLISMVHSKEDKSKEDKSTEDKSKEEESKEEESWCSVMQDQFSAKKIRQIENTGFKVVCEFCHVFFTEFFREK